MPSTGDSSKKTKRLGRGLSSLIADPVPVQIPSKVPSKSEQKMAVPEVANEPQQLGLTQVAVSAIEPSRFQPRRVFEPTSLDRLADSIARTGMMQPVILRPLGTDGTGHRRYELVAGERRWRAAAQAGLGHVPALVRELSDEQSAEWALIENVQREDLNPLERAWAFQALAQRFGLTHQQIADRVGLDRSTVANTIRLIELEEPIRDMIASGRLSAGHGRALLAAPAGAVRAELAIQASDEGWSVRRLERAAAAAAGGTAETPAGKSEGSSGGVDLAKMAARTSLEKQLGEHLGTRVLITTDRSGSRGRMMIEFYGVDHFDGLMAKFGFKLR